LASAGSTWEVLSASWSFSKDVVDDQATRLLSLSLNPWTCEAVMRGAILGMVSSTARDVCLLTGYSFWRMFSMDRPTERPLER